MKTTFILLMTLFLTTRGCTKDERESKYNNRCNFVSIDSEQYNNLTTDDFNIVDIKFEDRCLKITIRYGGGCKDVSLRLIDSDSVFESNPVQRNLKIILTDNDDCEALITKEFYFDITKLKVEGQNEVLLNFFESDKTHLYTY